MKPERGGVEDRSSTAKTGSVAQLVLKFNPECSLSMGEVPGSKPGRSNSSPKFFSFFCHSLFLILSSEIFLESPSALIHQSPFLSLHSIYLPQYPPQSSFPPSPASPSPTPTSNYFVFHYGNMMFFSRLFSRYVFLLLSSLRVFISQ